MQNSELSTVKISLNDYSFNHNHAIQSAYEKTIV